ncbi:MAG: hypothetical protein LC121_23220 [Anaerolineae bacterium]|nr:hypothetical protein [Anaerolineae bacterium]
MADMNLLQRALANLLAAPIAAAVAQATSAALTETRNRLTALEARPTLTDAERAGLAEAIDFAALLGAAAAGQVETPTQPAPPTEGGVTVEDVPAP